MKITFDVMSKILLIEIDKKRILQTFVFHILRNRLKLYSIKN